MKTLRIAIKTLVTAVLGLAVLAGLWACSSYGQSNAGKAAALMDESGTVSTGAQAAYAESPSIYNEAPTPEGWPALLKLASITTPLWAQPAHSTSVASSAASQRSSNTSRSTKTVQPSHATTRCSTGLCRRARNSKPDARSVATTS